MPLETARPGIHGERIKEKGRYAEQKCFVPWLSAEMNVRIHKRKKSDAGPDAARSASNHAAPEGGNYMAQERSAIRNNVARLRTLVLVARKGKFRKEPPP